MTTTIATRHQTLVDATAGSLRRSYVASINADAAIELSDTDAFASLQQQWDHLSDDVYLPDERRYRTRRYGSLIARPLHDGWEFVAVPGSAFMQSAELIPLYGGRSREFAPLTPAVWSNTALQSIVMFDLEVVEQTLLLRRPFRVGLHLIRVRADHDELCAPAPEGRHRDGHRFVAMHLMNRVNCVGGESTVHHDDDAAPFFATTLRQPLDTLFVDDVAIQHAVSPIGAFRMAPAHRDMLLVDFDEYDDGP
jgi:hypothetical protein